jgi:DUF1680 family protein
MDRRSFIVKAASLPVAAHAAVAAAFTAPAADETYAPMVVPHAARPIANRYRLTLDRIFHGADPSYTPELLLEDIHGTPGRRFTNFSGDVSGRWIGSLATASKMYGTYFPILDVIVPQVIAAQHAEGYFGAKFHFDAPDDDDLALLWGNGRLLVGLVEYYGLTKNESVLSSARKLGDFLVRLAPTFNSSKMSSDFNAAHFATSYICWTQQTEGLALLYGATHDKRYLDVAAAISERIERRPGDHVHGYLCSVRGALILYELTGDCSFLDRVETAWKDIVHSGDLLITGGVPEAWSPKKLRTEGCAECDWLRLNLSLWRATGAEKYLDVAENMIFNELAMNQFATGDFGHAVLNEIGTPETVMVRAWWCCTFHGLRAFPDIHRTVFRHKNDETFYDLPLDGQFNSSKFSAIAESKLAENGSVKIRVTKSSAEHSLILRSPSWAQKVSVGRNGRAVDGLRLSHLSPGDEIIVKYDMRLSQYPAGDGQLLAGKVAFRYGPWLLGASSETNKSYFNELESSNVLLSTSKQSKRDAVDSPFHVPVAAFTATYSPAEYPEQPSQVELRAIAEQTATRSARWQMAFIAKKDS